LRGSSAVAWFNLCGLRTINEEHGHAVGDAVLQALSDRLETALPGGWLTRYGGSSFAWAVELPADADPGWLSRQLSRAVSQAQQPVNATAAAGQPAAVLPQVCCGAVLADAALGVVPAEEYQARGGRWNVPSLLDLLRLAELAMVQGMAPGSVGVLSASRSAG
jgi:GGDEF domain-containing protein